MKNVLPALLALIVGVCAGCCVFTDASTYPKRSSLIADITSDTVALVIRDDDNDIATYCTGVWVAPDEILTADHCARSTVENAVDVMMPALGDADPELYDMMVQDLEDNWEVSYVIEPEATGMYREPKAVHKAHVVRHDKLHDLALVRVAKADIMKLPAHAYAPLAASTPAVGEEVHGMGHPSALQWTYIHGYVAAYREEKFKPTSKAGPFLQLTIPAWHGNSGGGAFNNEGELVGICSFLAPAPQTVFYIHLSNVKAFLKG